MVKETAKKVKKRKGCLFVIYITYIAKFEMVEDEVFTSADTLRPHCSFNVIEPRMITIIYLFLRFEMELALMQNKTKSALLFHIKLKKAELLSTV